MDSLIQESEWGKRNSMLEDKDFEFVTNEDTNSQEPEISEKDFELVQVDATVHEQKFQTRPTTFFKDSIKRFSKNKSSVVAGFILGGLLLLSFIVPLADRSDTKHPHPNETYLAPKLFNAGTGWWDGTVKYKNIAVDISSMPDAKTEAEKQEYWWPSATKFPQHSAISKKKFTDETYTNDATNFGGESYGKEGYIQFGYTQVVPKDTLVDYSSMRLNSLDLTDDLTLSVFDVYDMDKVHIQEGKNDLEKPENYALGDCALYFNYVEANSVTGELEHKDVQILDYKATHNIGSAIESLREDPIVVSNIIKTETGKTKFDNAYFSVRMNAVGEQNVCSLIRSIKFETASADEAIKTYIEDISFIDATKCVIKKAEDKGYWSSTGVKRIFLSKAYFCSFVYDTYEAAFGERVDNGFSIITLLEYKKNGWISLEGLSIGGGTTFVFKPHQFKCEILDSKKCPLSRAVTLDDFSGYDPNVETQIIDSSKLKVAAHIYKYKELGYSSMPRYLFGTDKSGKDMFKYVFEGLRTSLLLGVLTFVVCFLFGLVWGAVCGYFGGTVDLIMERFTDILAGVPWIVVMTLIIIHLGSNFWTFALALCMTGWIGTAARTRTQFYRFRGREYVLASRTLGASDARLIAKHILPNALGTIITGSVLMIPSVIFSEATISYLGLGLKNVSSLGVILSDNQSELLTSSYLLIFPAVVIALVMISFNLFGNGLRDAINPSLKGEE